MPDRMTEETYSEAAAQAARDAEEWNGDDRENEDGPDNDDSFDAEAEADRLAQEYEDAHEAFDVRCVW